MHLTLSLINGVVSTGEITMKLKQPWKSEFTNHASPAYQILAGNLATAVRMSVPVFYLPATLLLHFPPPPFTPSPPNTTGHKLRFASILVLYHAVKNVGLTYFL